MWHEDGKEILITYQRAQNIVGISKSKIVVSNGVQNECKKGIKDFLPSVLQPELTDWT
jgi:hypothetical protein